jgi:hypothetical protein
MSIQFHPKIDVIIGLITAMLAMVSPLAAAADGGVNTSFWVTNQWPGTFAMLSTMDMLQTVNVQQLDHVSNLPISRMLQEKAVMNEVVQQLESTRRLPAPFSR